jgi:CDP-glucose 4,6-dehydratase
MAMNVKDELVKTYKDKVVLVTGHTGFKGGWLALWLRSLGAKVVGYSLDPPTDPSFFKEIRLSSKITDCRGDILDSNLLAKVIDKQKPEFVFHLAAQPIVRRSYKDPKNTFYTNVLGTVNLLEIIRTGYTPTTCVCVTSDKCYENMGWDYGYRENDAMGGHDPYSASKGAAELVIASYRKSFMDPNNLCALASARAGNVLGGGDWAPDRILPDCIKSLVKKVPINIRNPVAIRPWQFILDPLFGYLLLGCKLKQNPKEFSEAWNFGPYYTNHIDVKTLTEKVVEEWGSGRWVSTLPGDAPHEATYLKLDIAKSITRLGWKPAYGIDETISKTVDWYKHYYWYHQVYPEEQVNVEVCQHSLRQIWSYMERFSGE